MSLNTNESSEAPFKRKCFCALVGRMLQTNTVSSLRTFSVAKIRGSDVVADLCLQEDQKTPG